MVRGYTPNMQSGHPISVDRCVCMKVGSVLCRFIVMPGLLICISQLGLGKTFRRAAVDT